MPKKKKQPAVLIPVSHKFKNGIHELAFHTEDGTRSYALASAKKATPKMIQKSMNRLMRIEGYSGAEIQGDIPEVTE